VNLYGGLRISQRMPAEMIEMKAAPYVMALFGLVLIVLGIREESMDIGQILIGLLQLVVGILMTGLIPLPFLDKLVVQAEEHEDPHKKF
tara:strand:+ start:2050 stop:2316 length:267 start_codon:yes stop_codon:yes gene_type:complete